MNRFPVIHGGITCREVVELVTAYLDGALGPEDTARVDAHLKECPPCTEYVDQIRATARLAAAATLEEHPDRDAILNAFRAFKRSHS